MLHQISQVSLGEVSEWSKAQAGGVLDTPMGELFLVAHPQGLSACIHGAAVFSPRRCAEL